MLVGFSENHERQEASRETEVRELRAKIGELVIERDFFVEGLRSFEPRPESRDGRSQTTHGSASYGSAAWCRSPARRSTTRARARPR